MKCFHMVSASVFFSHDADFIGQAYKVLVEGFPISFGVVNIFPRFIFGTLELSDEIVHN